MTNQTTMRDLDEGRGAVRTEDVFDTTIDDLWQACTTPDRLARWIARVSGSLTEGGIVHAVFTSSWTGDLRIETCEAPHHLVLTSGVGDDDPTTVEVWLTSEGDRTRLAVEERGLPRPELPFHAAGWQVHLQDLQRLLTTGQTPTDESWDDGDPSWVERFRALKPTYQQAD